MSDTRAELERLSREVDRLKDRLPSGAGKKASKQNLEALFAAQVRESMEKGGDLVATGITWIAVVADGSGGTASSHHHSVWTGPIKELPSEEKLRNSATILTHTPLQMRAMHQLLSQAYEGQPMQMTKAALAFAAGVDEETLERELAPLVPKKTLRRLMSAEGEDSYKLVRWDLFLLQLSLTE